jgi:hypothetical protein
MPERKFGGRLDTPLGNAGNPGAVRRLVLRRRRSRVPWIYLVYHAVPDADADPELDRPATQRPEAGLAADEAPPDVMVL